MATRGRKSENTVDMPVESIRFSQPKIETKFQDGRLLKDTLEEILKNRQHMIREVIPSIEVYWSPKGYHAAATGNRRLYLFKLLSEYGLLETIPVIIKQKSKSTIESQETKCAQKTILAEIIKKHVAAKVPEKSDENKAESSATTSSQGKKDQTPSQKSSRKALRSLTNNPPVESPKPPKSVDKVKKHKPQEKEDGKESSTTYLRSGLRKRKSDTTPEMLFSTENPSTQPCSQDPPDDKQSQDRKEPTGMKDSFRSLNESSEGEAEDSPKRLRLSPSPETEPKPAATGNSQDMADLNLESSD